jgi:HEAT repeat protein
MTEHLLVVVLVVEAGFFLAGVLGLFACAAVRSLGHRRTDHGTRRARELAREAVLGDSPAGPAGAALRELSHTHRRAVLMELAGSVGALARVRELADESGVTARAERWCCSRRWWRRLRGLRVLARVGVEPAALRRFLDDPHPAVRAAAADAAAHPVPPDVVSRLLGMLDDRDRSCRFAALAALVRAGREAVGDIREYLAAEHVAQPEAGLAVATALAEPALLGPALRLSAAPETVVRRRAAALLARIGGDTVTERLEGLLTDPDAGVRAEAVHGLGELGHWPAAAYLADALRDPAWDVRAAAALALHRLGPVGRVYLRRATGADDRFAADIARQILAMPDEAMSLAGR